MVVEIFCLLVCVATLLLARYDRYKDGARRRVQTAATTDIPQGPQRPTDQRLLDRKFDGTVNRPPVFSGNPADFREWVFAIELAMVSQRVNDDQEQVRFAASYLQGNARLWLMSVLDSGACIHDWPTLKQSLGDVYGPVHEQEEARLKLFGLVQRGSLDAYVQEFTNLCLQVNDLNDHSKAVLFVRGLHAAIGHSALREHPTTLGQAIRAARMAAMQASGVWREQTTTGTGIRRSRHPGPAPHAQASTPRQPVSPWGRQQQQSNRTSEPICYSCRKPGHIARNCPVIVNSPNASSQ